MLPESDGILYVNLKPVHTFFRKDLKPPQRVPEYQEFVDATGVDWEQIWTRSPLPCTACPTPTAPTGRWLTRWCWWAS